MPIIGTRRAWAMALAAAMPTRRPVNRPGPMSTATTEISLSSTRAWRRTKSMDGASVSAWRLPRAEWAEASTPSWPPMAQPTCWVDGGDPEDEHQSTFQRGEVSPRDRWRADQRLPTQRSSRSRSSSPSP